MLRRSVPCARLLTGVVLAYWLVLLTSTHLPARLLVAGPGGSDKLAHFVAYGILAFLLAWAVSARRRVTPHTYAALFLACLAYAILDELAQIPVAGRVADFWDAVADGVGTLLGLAVHRFWQAGIDRLAIRRLSYLHDLRRVRSLPR